MYFFKGAVSSLESLRTGQAGVLALGLFITQDTATPEATRERITQLKALIDIGWLLLAAMTPLFGFLIGPYWDYNSALL